MIVVMGHIKLAPGEIERAAEAMAKQLAATRAEDGCIHYSFARDVLDPDTVIVSERWRDAGAIAAHSASAHMKEFNKVMGAAKILDIKVTAWDADGERILIGG